MFFLPLLQMPSVSSSLELSSRFLGMCDDWIRMHDCDALVQALGVTLRPLTLITEWVPYGPLDAYLQHHGHTLKQVSGEVCALYCHAAPWSHAEACVW